MTALEALQSVQYVTVDHKRLAVVDATDWETMLEWLETVEDVKIVSDALSELQSVEGDREALGWLRWDDIREELT